MSTPTPGNPGEENPYGTQPPAYPQPGGQPPAYPQPGGQPPVYPQAYPQGGYAQPGYPQPGWQGGYGVPDTSGNNLGVWSLILGIAGWLCFGFLTGIPAIVLGSKSRRAAAEGRATNGGMGTAGMVLGWAITILTVLGVALMVVLLATGHLETTRNGSSFEWHIGD